MRMRRRARECIERANLASAGVDAIASPATPAATRNQRSAHARSCAKSGSTGCPPGLARTPRPPAKSRSTPARSRTRPSSEPPLVSTRTESPQQPTEPRHAATVILLREHGGEIEVLLTRRHEQMSFMGGMWVFPGGALCSADTSSAALALIAAPEELGCERFVDLHDQPLPQSLCLGLAMAACRETFEETGVLL